MHRIKGYKVGIPKGFTLVELSIALAIIALAIVMFLGASSGFISSKRYEVTAIKLKAVESALALYVAQNKRLPCPAYGTDPSGTAGSGTERRDPITGDCLGNQINGVVPALTLGMTEAEVLDGWNNRITYRVYSGVNGSLTRDNSMDMSWCDPAGSAAVAVAPNNLCNAACTSTALANCVTPTQFLAGKGLEVRNAAGVVLISPAAGGQGAAYILVSHGENRGMAYTDNGVLLATPTGPQIGTAEAQNNNGVALRIAPDFYIDSAIRDPDNTDHFDDLVLRPSIISVVSKAQLGPRAH